MPKISNIQLKERKKWFSEWLPEVEHKVSNWILSLSKQDQDHLDFTIDSLNYVEDLILKQFPTNESAFSVLSNSSTIDIFGSYIGETLRRNHCIELTWVCDLLNEGYDTWVNFHPFLTSKYTNCDQIINMQYLLHQRTGDKLIKQFLNKENLFLDALKKRDLKANSLTITNAAYSYKHFILVLKNGYALNNLKDELENYNRSTKRNYQVGVDRNRLVLTLTRDFNFHFLIDKSKGVKEESREIAESYSGKIDPHLISNCSTRIEFWGDEDISGAYMNESLFILEFLSKNKDLLICNMKSGQFI